MKKIILKAFYFVCLVVVMTAFMRYRISYLNNSLQTLVTPQKETYAKKTLKTAENSKETIEEKINKIIKKGAEVNAKDSYGKTALLSASEHIDNPEIIKTLLNNGATIDTKDNKGMTALILAARYNKNPDIAEILLTSGADINEKDNEGMTALMYAAFENPNPDVFKTLLKYKDMLKIKEDDTNAVLIKKLLLVQDEKTVNAPTNDETTVQYVEDEEELKILTDQMISKISEETSVDGCFNCDIDSEFFVKIDNRIYFVIDKTNKSALFGHFGKKETTDATLVYWDEQENKIHEVYNDIHSRYVYYADGKFYLYKYKKATENNCYYTIYSVDRGGNYRKEYFDIFTQCDSEDAKNCTNTLAALYATSENFYYCERAGKTADSYDSIVVFSIDKDGKNYKEYGKGEIIAFDKENDTLVILREFHKKKYKPYKEAEAKIDIVRKGKIIRNIVLNGYEKYHGKVKIIGDYIWYNADTAGEDDIIYGVTRLNWKNPEDKVSYDTNVCFPEYYKEGGIDNMCNNMINVVQNKNRIYAILEARSTGSAGGTNGGDVYELDLSSNKAELLYKIPDGVIDGGPEGYISPNVKFDHDGKIQLSNPKTILDGQNFAVRDGKLYHFVVTPIEADDHLKTEKLPDDETNIIVEYEKKIKNKVYAMITKIVRDVDGGVGWRDGFMNLKTWYVVKDLSTNEFKIMASVEMKDNIKEYYENKMFVWCESKRKVPFSYIIR